MVLDYFNWSQGGCFLVHEDGPKTFSLLGLGTGLIWVPKILSRTKQCPKAPKTK